MSFQPSELSWSIMSEMKRQSAKRCLFGRPDPEKLSEDLKRQEKNFSEAENERCRKKWGFDPETGPIEGGPYEYEIIAMDTLSDKIPAFYMKTYKSKPVRIMRTSNCHIEEPKKFISAKRKLHLGEDVDGNRNFCDGVLNKRRLGMRTISCHSTFQSISPLPAVSQSGDSVCGSFHEPSGGLTRSSSAPSFTELSSTTRNKDMKTPSRPRSLHQSSLKGEVHLGSIFFCCC